MSSECLGFGRLRSAKNGASSHDAEQSAQAVSSLTAALYESDRVSNALAEALQKERASTKRSLLEKDAQLDSLRQKAEQLRNSETHALRRAEAAESSCASLQLQLSSSEQRIASLMEEAEASNNAQSSSGSGGLDFRRLKQEVWSLRDALDISQRRERELEATAAELEKRCEGLVAACAEADEARRNAAVASASVIRSLEASLANCRQQDESEQRSHSALALSAPCEQPCAADTAEAVWQARLEYATGGMPAPDAGPGELASGLLVCLESLTEALASERARCRRLESSVERLKAGQSKKSMLPQPLPRQQVRETSPQMQPSGD
jgi:hypothetical protein